MSSENPKRAVFAGLAEVAKALGHGHRLEILELLAQGERSVEALADRAGLSVANASQHLQLMRRAGLLASRRDGKRVLYRPERPVGARSDWPRSAASPSATSPKSARWSEGTSMSAMPWSR